MARDTSTDQITNDLIQRYVSILSPLAGWGALRDMSKAIYPNLGLPQPQEPFPAAYVYVSNIQFDWGLLHQGLRRDIYTIGIRILGGPSTPYTVVSSGPFKGDVPEVAVYKIITGVINELTYRPFLNDPVTNEPFRYLDPNSRASVNPVSRVTGYSYSEQGTFIGMEVPASVTLIIKQGRAG